jgi:hypothetical protein
MMIRVARGLLPLAFLAALLADCAPAPTATPGSIVPPPPTPTPTPPASPSESALGATMVADSANGVSFERPADWTRWRPNEHNPINDGPLIYLSTDPLLPACATAPSATPNPPDSRGRACDWPLVALSPNGVLVTWLTTRILAPLPSVGEGLVMNGETTRLMFERRGPCAEIGGDETVSVLVPIGQPTPASYIAVVACLRGPDLATSEAQLRAMFASALIDR